MRETLHAAALDGLGATDRGRLLQPMVAAVRSASAAIMRVYGGDVEVRLKDDDSPLTEADIASHRALTAALSAIEPSLPIVSEEGAQSDIDARSTWPAYWLIDPLDGTKEFLARNGEFTVNVALIEGNRPTLGVVGAPARDQIFTGDVSARRAVRVDAGGESVLACRRYSGGGPTVVASRRHGGPALAAYLERLETEEGPVTLCSVGSSLKLCLLAEARADVYPRLAPTSEWDTAAAQAVLEAAGGQVLQLSGEPLRYSKADVLNPAFVAVADGSVDWLRRFRP